MSNDQLDHKAMATLNLEKKGKDIIVSLRIYYLEPLQQKYRLGIACNNEQVVVQPIVLEETKHVKFVTKEFDLSSKITCVLVTDDVKPVLWGSTEKLDDTRLSMIKAMKQVKTVENKSETVIASTPTNVADTHLFEEPTEEELEKLVDEVIEEDNFFASEMKDLPEGDQFFAQIKDQIESIFASNQEDLVLASLVPHSRWVQVDGDTEGHYVLGVIYEDGEPKYVAYGIRGKMNELPQQNYRPYSQWLPLDPNNDTLDGYWVMFQDAMTGDNCLIEDM